MYVYNYCSSMVCPHEVAIKTEQDEFAVLQGLFLISPPWTATLSSWRGLHALVILGAMGSGEVGQGRVGKSGSRTWGSREKAALEVIGEH